jgi:hypothetical protein
MRFAAVFLLALFPGGGFEGRSPEKGTTKKIAFTDVHEQTVQFIRYYEAIELTREQEAVKREALSSLPAACCSNNSAYTC